MASAHDRIREVLTAYGETYDNRKGGTVWDVQGTPVIAHRCLERVAAKAGIVFDLPQILRSERDEAVILVAGTLKDRREWSIGEALVNVNYRVSGKQAAYVYAMSEKRAKDRVILKLVELHGLAYSEEEADELRQDQDAGTRKADRKSDAPTPMSVEHMLHEIGNAPDHAAIAGLKADSSFRAGYRAADEVSRKRIEQALAKAAEECAA